MRIVIKIGSKLLTDGKKKIKWWFIFKLCWQINKLMKFGHEVVLITSGAIKSDYNENRSENLRAGVGQVKLIFLYAFIFKIFFKIDIAQILFTDKNLFDKNGKFIGENSILYKTITEAFSKKVIPVLNYNDTVDDKQTRAFKECADNDKTAKWTALLIKADLCIIGFDKLGLLDKKGDVIYQVNQNKKKFALSCAKGGNPLGHGKEGMKTKISVAIELSENGIKTVLAPANKKNFILRAIANEKNFGTIFIPK